MARRPRAKYEQGVYKPVNPEKIIPNQDGRIIYRSALEWRWMYRLDTNEKVRKWGSECLCVPYKKPTTGRIHRYYPDLLVEFTDGTTHVVEIKPDKEIRLVQEYLETGRTPKKIKTKYPNEKPTTYQYRVKMWAVNVAKWEATEAFCKKKGWKFIKVGEKVPI
jgi:hypothetical protein